MMSLTRFELRERVKCLQEAGKLARDIISEQEAEIKKLKDDLAQTKAHDAISATMVENANIQIAELRLYADLLETTLRKFKQIEYSGERYDRDTRSDRAACVFCGRFHNEHSHREDCPFYTINNMVHGS